jgi:alpha-L-rhamnosidase
MTDDSSGTHEFHLAEFREPPSIHWPGYFWKLNDALEPERLREQLRDMHAHGARSVCPHAMPRAFRTADFNSALTPDYLTPEYFESIRVMMDEVARLGMHAWLYDEGGWPSGLANGRVVARNPDLACQMLVYKDGAWRPDSNPGRVDLLNPETTKLFLELTHDGYAKAVGEHFGGAIRFAFTDEPFVKPIEPGKAIPWTASLPEEFRNRFGYEIEDHLDVFLADPEDGMTPEQMVVRCDFYDTVSGLFQKSFFRPIKEWCDAHGLQSGGHLGGDDYLMGALKGGYTHMLRPLSEMGCPGIDTIWRQIFPGQQNHHFPKFASSAARHQGSPYSFTESFAIHGSGLTPEQMRWILHYQFVRGITLLVISNYPLSTADGRLMGPRPVFGKPNPLWDSLAGFHAYTARLSYALTRGEAVVNTALYYPMRDLWATGAMGEAGTQYEAIAEALLASQCEFDIIDDDLIANSATQIKGGRLCTNGASYDRVILGPTAWLTGSAADKLEAFSLAGGRVVALGSLPFVRNDGGQRLRATNIRVCETVGEVADLVMPLVQLDPPCPDIRVTARKTDTGALYFLSHEGEAAYEGRVVFREDASALLVDLQEGNIIPLDATRLDDGACEITLTFLPGEACLIAFDDSLCVTAKPWREEPGAVIALDGEWGIGVNVHHDVDVNGVRLVKGEGIFRDTLKPWSELFNGDFSGTATYVMEVSIPSEWRGLDWRLSLGAVEYAASVCVNGIDCDHALWKPWELALPDLGDVEGVRIEITVANTLANAMCSERMIEARTRETGPGWGSRYDSIEISFEKESLGGGLLGPVVLRGGRRD